MLLGKQVICLESGREKNQLMVTEHHPDRDLLDLRSLERWVSVAFGPHHSPMELSRCYSPLFASSVCSPGSLPVFPVASSLKHLIPGRAALCKEERAHWFLCLFELDEHRSFLERALIGFQNLMSGGLDGPIVFHCGAALAQAQG